MARWRLTQKHYINVAGTEWEYKEITNSGRQVKKVFEVPLYLDPDSPADHNYPGEIIISNGKGALPKDHIYTGPPGPDMAPLDEEAQALSDAESPKWVHPIEGLDADLGAFKASQQASGMVPKAEFDTLKALVEQLAAQNTALLGKLEAPARRA